jgi:hypothetical protein
MGVRGLSMDYYRADNYIRSSAFFGYRLRMIRQV